MTTVYVRDNESLDSAVRRWKKKCANDELLVIAQKTYEKPSVRKKESRSCKKKIIQIINPSNLEIFGDFLKTTFFKKLQHHLYSKHF